MPKPEKADFPYENSALAGRFGRSGRNAQQARRRLCAAVTSLAKIVQNSPPAATGPARNLVLSPGAKRSSAKIIHKVIQRLGRFLPLHRIGVSACLRSAR